MATYTIGVSAITLGNVASDGGPGTSLAPLGLTNEGSCKLNQADPDTTNFFAEEQDSAVFSFSKAGATTVTFQILNPDTATLKAVFGGSIGVATVNSKQVSTWNMPASVPTIEQTVQITPQQGMVVIIPRGLVTAKLNGELAKKNLFMIDVTVTALAPIKAGVGPIQFVQTAP